MNRRSGKLLDALVAGVTAENSTTSLLQTALLLSAEGESMKLRDWATAELHGYARRDLPEYRKVAAVIRVDSIVGFTRNTGWQIGVGQLPKVLRDAGLSDELSLRQSVGELEDLAPRGVNRAIEISLPGSTFIAAELDKASGQAALQRTTAVYWSTSTSTIRGVIERVRATLAEFVSELLGSLPDGAEDLPAGSVERAITLVLHGSHPIVNLSQGGNILSTGASKELIMGDKFENISGSTIVNRSLLSNALNTVESRGDIDAANALRELQRIVDESGDSAAADYLDTFNAELARETPRKPILQAMWAGLIQALPLIASVATITTAIGHLIGMPAG